MQGGWSRGSSCAETVLILFGRLGFGFFFCFGRGGRSTDDPQSWRSDCKEARLSHNQDFCQGEGLVNLCVDERTIRVWSMAEIVCKGQGLIAKQTLAIHQTLARWKRRLVIIIWGKTRPPWIGFYARYPSYYQEFSTSYIKRKWGSPSTRPSTTGFLGWDRSALITSFVPWFRHPPVAALVYEETNWCIAKFDFKEPPHSEQITKVFCISFHHQVKWFLGGF